MPIIVVCSSCDTRLKANDGVVGRRVKCPKCGEAIMVKPSAAKPAVPKPAQRPEKAEEAITARRKKPPEADTEPYAPEESDTLPEEARPKKKKKKRRRKQRKPAGVPGWVWWLGGTGIVLLALLIGVVVAVRAGHGVLVIAVALQLAIMLPISAVIMIFAMILSSALGGGIYFGELGEVIVKSLGLLFVINLIYLIPYVGGWIALAVWLFGSMVLFDLDIWEARFFIFINWSLNFVVKMFLVGLILSAASHGHVDEEKDVLMPPRPAVSKEEESILQDIKAKGGDYSWDENDPDGGVIRISFEGIPITDEDLISLKIFKKLTTLELGSTQITDAGLEHLKGITSLQSLDVTGTRISDKGLVHLKGLKQLDTLGLANTKVTNKGAQGLQKALPRLKIFR